MQTLQPPAAKLQLNETGFDSEKPLGLTPRNGCFILNGNLVKATKFLSFQLISHTKEVYIKHHEKRKHQDYGYSAEIRAKFGAEISCFSSLLRSVCSFSLHIAVLCGLTVIPTRSSLFMNIVAVYASMCDSDTR